MSVNDEMRGEIDTYDFDYPPDAEARQAAEADAADERADMRRELKQEDQQRGRQ